ncbi:MAG: M15 family metallopeptidase [Clostridia bacterium]|nr:M15 family metallopeptidase [Clostridia bacterium]
MRFASYNRIAALLLAALFIACFIAGCSGTPEPVPIERPTSAPTAAPTPSPTPEPTPEPTPSPTPAPYAVIELESYPLSGNFVLVNYSHRCDWVDEAGTRLLALHGNTGRWLLLTNNDHALLPEVVTALDSFAEAFCNRTGGDRLLVTSSFRTLEYQQRVYDEKLAEQGAEYASMYVALPGFSEHHTGLAVDLSTMSAAGERVPLISHAAFEWVKAHCSDFGFILRYPVGSEGITHVAFEPWHFRYVGKPLAKAIEALGMTYEEFTEHLAQYTVEKGLLYLSEDLCCPDVADINALPDEGWVIYTAEEGSTFPAILDCSYMEIGSLNDGRLLGLFHLGH